MQYNYFFCIASLPQGIPISLTKGVIHRLDKSKVRRNCNEEKRREINS